MKKRNFIPAGLTLALAACAHPAVFITSSRMPLKGACCAAFRRRSVSWIWFRSPIVDCSVCALDGRLELGKG